MIHKVNLKFTEFLDENGFSLPKVANGYIGDEIVPMQIPVPSKSPAVSRIPQHQPFPTNPSTRTITMTSSSSNNNLQHRSSFNSDIDGTVGRVSEDGDNNSVVSELTLDNASTLGGGGGAARRGSSLMQPRRSTDSMTSQQGVGAAAVGGGRPPRKVQRKSVFDVSSGRRLINAQMLEYIKEECIDSEGVDAVIERSAEDPSILLGWQVRIVFLFFPLLFKNKNPHHLFAILYTTIFFSCI